MTKLLAMMPSSPSEVPRVTPRAEPAGVLSGGLEAGGGRRHIQAARRGDSVTGWPERAGRLQPAHSCARRSSHLALEHSSWERECPVSLRDLNNAVRSGLRLVTEGSCFCLDAPLSRHGLASCGIVSYV